MTKPNHEHQWGPLEQSRFAGTPHRKCRVPGCKEIKALEDDDMSDSWDDATNRYETEQAEQNKQERIARYKARGF